MTPGKFIGAVPSKFTPPIALVVSSLVAIAAVPLVDWLPAVLTPGRFIGAEPSNDTPPIVLAVARIEARPANKEVVAVVALSAVAAFPVVFKAFVATVALSAVAALPDVF